jgi:hypothetical protein
MKSIIKTLFVLFAATFLYLGTASSQVTVTVGTETNSTVFPFRTFWMDAKSEYLYTATELYTAGALPGTITQIGFDVSIADPATMNGFTIKMQSTSATSLGAFTGSGWTTVYSSAYAVPGTGWQMIALTTPFVWDGSSNLLVQFCFDNAAYTANSEIYASFITNMSWCENADLNPGSGCDMAAGSTISYRPNTRFVINPVFACGNLFLGDLTMTSNWQNAPYTSATIPIWRFNAVAGAYYDFSLCTNTEDTYLYIYDSLGNQIAFVDDNGPFCSGLPASLQWLCPASGRYYVTAAHLGCAVMNNSGDLAYRETIRACADCAPANVNLGNITTTVWGGSITGNCLVGGKWSGSFIGMPGVTYHFDLCPDAPGAGTADFDIDIKITDASCSILAGQDGSCTALSWRPNDFTWVCPAAGTYYVILAPFNSYNSHTCTGTALNTFTMQYYREPLTLTCPPGAYLEGEPDCADGYIDNYNGGCNSTPNVFNILPTACETVICGKAGVYNSLGNRDTDWYQFVTTDSTEIHIEGIAEFDLQLGLIDGNAGCPVAAFMTVAMVTEGQLAILDTVVGAGTWWIWAGPSNWNNWPCGSDYQITLTKVVHNPSIPLAMEDTACGTSTFLLPMADHDLTTYYWQGGSCGNDMTYPASAQFTVDSTGYYFVRGYSNGCWSDCDSNYITILGGELEALADGFANGDTICPGESVTFDVNFSGTFDTVYYRWREGLTILRDWDLDPVYLNNSPVSAIYAVDVEAYSYGMGGTLVYGAENPANDYGIAAMLNADGRCGAVTFVDAYTVLLTLTDFLNYSTVIVWSNSPIIDQVEVGNALADYVDAGGHVIVVAFGGLAGGSNWGVTGRFMTDGYCPAVQTDNFSLTPTTLGTVNLPGHPIMSGVNTITTNYHVEHVALNSGGVNIFNWATGMIGGAEKTFPGTGKTMLLNMWPGGWSGDANLLLANAAALYYEVPTHVCTFTDDVPVYVATAPDAAGAITGDLLVCEGTTGVPYTIATVPNATVYNWSYTGSGATINGSGISINMDFPNGSTSGDLSVYGSNAWCDGASSTISIVVDPCTGIENDYVNALNIMPNPNTGLFSVEFNAVASGDYDFMIYDVLGQIILNQTLAVNAGSNRVDLNLLSQPAGTYYLKIMTGDQETVKTFVIKR